MRVGHFISPQDRDRFRRSYAAAMAVLPQPDETADVDTGFGTVRVLRFGPTGGSPFVLLPGKAAPASVWAPNLPPLIEHRTVYALDVLGGPGESVQTVPIRNTADQVR